MRWAVCRCLRGALRSASRTASTKSTAARSFQRGRSVTLEARSEEHTSELQSPDHLVCRLLLEKKKIHKSTKTWTQASVRPSRVRILCRTQGMCQPPPVSHVPQQVQHDMLSTVPSDTTIYSVT